MGREFRTGLLAACAIAVVSVALGAATAAAQTALTVGKSAPNADPIIPVNVGDKLGIFKKHGLDLKIVDFGGGARMPQPMAPGTTHNPPAARPQLAFVPTAP